ncbi:MAG: TetR/AcrR family transcriptional regulator [Candidatus Bipolaricaulota bacterium]|nr:TetR/AcrR family transcriptional regulator [Candidatus Bipolaricaulota bacterium]MDW8141540.1 TetR/AcrR family transcriptional regulator [Candidatus Bipolaricaulota bacterium]
MRVVRQRRPTTKHGVATFERLLQAGTAILAQRGLRRASVAEICRRGRVANGTFYQYFRNKDELLLTLLAQLSQTLPRQIAQSLAPEAPVVERLLNALRAHFEFIASHQQLYRIFREAEFTHTEVPKALYQQIAKLYHEILSKHGRSRAAGEAIAYALVGVTEFLALHLVFWHPQPCPQLWPVVREFLTHGISGPAPAPPSREAARTLITPPQRAPQAQASTRGRLLLAAERAFGQHGFYEAQIAEIVRAAGVAHGTFYKYFTSKEAIFAELVREINAQLRAHLRASIYGLGDRRLAERAGFRAFVDFIREHPLAYRIVREAEFVGSPPTTPGRWYYERLAQGYQAALPAAMAVGQIRSADSELLAYMLMGIGHFIGLRWVVWKGQTVSDDLLDAVMDFILHGL